MLPLQVIFITEYMSSGSLKQFLKKTKKNHKTMNEKVTLFFSSCMPIFTEIHSASGKLFQQRILMRRQLGDNMWLQFLFITLN